MEDEFVPPTEPDYREEVIKDKVSLENDLANNELLQRDLKRVIGIVTPYISLVGLLSGGVTVAAHIVEKRVFQQERRKIRDMAYS